MIPEIMNEYSLIRRIMGQALLPAIGLAVMAYFAYHAWYGEHGFLAWLRVSQEIEEVEARLAEVRAERVAFERRVALLRPESLDPDMLDERARAVLGYSHPHDIVIFRDDTERQDTAD